MIEIRHTFAAFQLQILKTCSAQIQKSLLLYFMNFSFSVAPWIAPPFPQPTALWINSAQLLHNQNTKPVEYVCWNSWEYCIFILSQCEYTQNPVRMSMYYAFGTQLTSHMVLRHFLCCVECVLTTRHKQAHLGSLWKVLSFVTPCLQSVMYYVNHSDFKILNYKTKDCVATLQQHSDLMTLKVMQCVLPISAIKMNSIKSLSILKIL